jgi:transketolase
VSNKIAKLMRDSFLEKTYSRMATDSDVFILSDDMGAPVLDKVRSEHPTRFVNVGIAEQNLINVASGLAMEGMKVVAYGIAPFFMRAYEQIRVNLAISGQLRPQNVNMVGVGSGISYDVSGPTHHCLEDLSAMRSLPNISVFSPCDWVCSGAFADYALTVASAKYVRLDGKKLDQVYDSNESFDFSLGFKRMRRGAKVCLVSTGYATRLGVQIAERLASKGVEIGLVDVFLLEPVALKALAEELSSYDAVVSFEEGFLNRAGLDLLVSQALEGRSVKRVSFGFPNKYLFEFGPREYLYGKAGCSVESVESALAAAAR